MQIELLKAHEHANQKFCAGEKLTVDKAQGQWLIDLEVARQTDISSPTGVPKAGKPLSLCEPSNPVSPDLTATLTKEISK